MRLIKFKKIIYQIFVLASGCWLLAAGASASRVDELKSQITGQNSQIEEIERKIEQYQRQIDETLEEKTSLQNEIRRLEINAKKLNSDIHLTKKKIETSGFSIEKLDLEITKKIEEISLRKDSLAEIIRNMNEMESQSLVEITLAHDTFSDFFSDLERMKGLQKEINVNLAELKQLKNIMEEQKTEEQLEKNKQERLKSQLTDQKVLVDNNKSAKNTLLKQTQNKEENYRSLMEEKIAKKEAFERELAELESQLRIEIDPSALPSVGSGVLAWPLNSIKITQYFGNTKFATANPQIYNGMGHTGVDFRASVGAPVSAASSGIVEGTGNTDEIRGCYSYGKWVLIKHNNGLSTLYAHLSLIKVNKGQSIAVGDLVGYSGQTGYATGPHLHFGVYATQGVKIMKFENSINCKNAHIPIADKKAYLNPLSYL